MGYKHGGARRIVRRDVEFVAWASALGRCNNPKNQKFPLYGGRGIKVCARWADAYASFLADMGRKPSPAHSLDRIDVNGDYAPNNCRWATASQQARNRQRNRLITINGVTRCLTEWEEVVGINHGTVKRRLRLGWSYHDAITVPVSGVTRYSAFKQPTRWSDGRRIS